MQACLQALKLAMSAAQCASVFRREFHAVCWPVRCPCDLSILSSCVYSSVDNVDMCMYVNQSALLCFDVVTSGSWISEY